MKVRLLLLILALFIHGLVHSQKKISPKEQSILFNADRLFNQFAYAEAATYYERFLAYSEGNDEVMVKIADCYYKIKEFNKALQWYDSALLHGPLLSQHALQYTNTLMSHDMPEKAIAWLTLYLQKNPTDLDAKKKFDGLEQIKYLSNDSSLYTINSVPFNSSASEFSPAFYDGGVLFVSSREAGGESKDRGKKGKTFFDLYHYTPDSDKSVTPNRLSDVINSTLHEGPMALYDSGRKMIFTRNNANSKRKDTEINTIQFQLFYSEKNLENEWTEPTTLSINDKQYSMGHPSISTDGMILYFASNIPGGYGGSDIYKSQWAGAWGKPENLGPEINSMGNEIFPYLFNDSLLFFSSDGYPTLGGIDIFKVNLNHNTGVYNMGYPLNSKKDDFGIVLYPEGNTGYFSSNRIGGQGDDDIYQFKLKPKTPYKPAPLIKAEPSHDTVVYTIQLLALKNPRLVPKMYLKQLRGVIKHDGKDGLHRYTFGEYKSKEEAIEVLNTIKGMKYADAFIRKKEEYSGLSTSQGKNVDELYEKMGRTK